MTYIYLIRHAQAGTRENYDVLSDLGRKQAQLLGRHFVREGIEPGAIYSGSMERQRLTAEITRETIAAAGLDAPNVTTDERWNEFSLINVYRAIARRLRQDDSQFARDLEEMQEAIRRDPHSTGGATGRCDATVIRAWMENRYSEYEGESWVSFKNRIECVGGELFDHPRDKSVAVFTSATPVAVLAARALGLSSEKLRSILGVIYNSSITVVRAREDDLRLFSFNGTPHLEPAVRTFR